MAEKYRENTNPDQAGVRRDMTAAVSERTHAGLLIPTVIALMGLVLFVVLFTRFNTPATGREGSSLTAAQSTPQARGDRSNGVYPTER